MPVLILYSRNSCHLCDQALAILSSLRRTLAFEVLVVDIDHDDELVARYGTSIPVVSLDGEDLLAWPFTAVTAAAVLRQRLRSAH